MYADRSSGRKRSVRDRLGSGGGATRSRSDDAKRYRQADGTWRRELYQDSVGNKAEISSRSIQGKHKSNLQPSTEVVKKSSVPDLREKLSGVQHPQLNSTIEIPKPAPEISKSGKPVQKRETPATEAPTVPKKVSVPAPSAPKLSQEKV
ncbi:hypothetical protein PR202_gb02600 [Eleusine coracana subsp. coracana]|uniref:Uncharacterized protein n=1 Tax=Eleusine coracana subsp. coracana TaxID=191504 RepID=A0AAV5DZS9_ELECO|nr:hypothetical protein PR202_gb02600 [Eleusine coracana subsp. coracana]